MAFKVQIVTAAQRDIADVTAFLHAASPDAAQKWLLNLERAIQGLAEMPLRFAQVTEAEELKRPLRSFVYYSHRVIYEVDEPNQIVSVLRVYHSARAPLQLEDLTP